MTVIVPYDASMRAGCASVLVDAFREFAPDSWPTLEDGLEEVDECVELGPVRVAVEGAELLGWVGLRFSYAKVWELHPLAVAPSHQRSGIGRALVAEIERVAAESGAATIQLGSDDQPGWTSLADVDVYPNPLEHLAALRDVKGHPFVFYEKCGFSVTGIVPDANGFGKPDIMLSKRVG